MTHFCRFSCACLTAMLMSSPGSMAEEPRKGEKPPAAKIALTLEGHDADVYAVRYSPDGSRIATASFDKLMKLWDARSGKEVATFSGHQGKVLSLAFSSDGRSLLTGSEDKTLKLWDVPGDGAAAFAGHTGAVHAMALSPDMNYVATGSADGTVRLWARASRKELLKLEGTSGPVRCVAFSADGKKLASGGDEKSVRIWDVAPITSPAAPTVASGGAVELLKQGAPWRYFKGRTEPPAEWKNLGFDDSKWEKGASGFGYSNSADELTTIGTKLDDMMNAYMSVYVRASFKIDDPKAVERLQLKVLVDDGMVAYLNGQEVGRDNIDGNPPAHDGVAKTSHEALSVEIDLSPHLGKLVAGDNVIAVQGHNHELESSDLVLTPTLTGALKASENKPPPPPRYDLAKLDGSLGPVIAVAWSPDGAQVAASSEDRNVRVWPVGGGEPKAFDNGTVARGLAFVGGGRVAVGGEGAIKLWSTAENKVESTLEGHEGAVLTLAARKDLMQLASGGADKTVRVWDLNARKELKSIKGHEGAVHAVAFNEDGKLVVSGGADKTLRAWSIESGKEIRKFTSDGEVRAVAAGPNDRYYSAGDANEALEWRSVSLDAVRTFSGHGGAVHRVLFSPDGTLAASSSADKTVRLWNRGDGKEVRSIAAHDSTVYAIAFNHDGSLIASSSLDKAVKIWKVADGSMVKKLDGHGEGVFCIQFSSDGQFLYSGSSDRTLRKWNVADGTQTAVFEGHPSWVCGIALFPGDGKLVSVDYGGNLITWNLADGKRLGWRKIPAVIYDLSLSPDGKRVTAASLTGKAYVIETEE